VDSASQKRRTIGRRSGLFFPPAQESLWPDQDAASPGFELRADFPNIDYCLTHYAEQLVEAMKMKVSSAEFMTPCKDSCGARYLQQLRRKRAPPSSPQLPPSLQPAKPPARLVTPPPGPPPTQPVNWYPVGGPSAVYLQPVYSAAGFFPPPEAAPIAPTAPEARWIRILRYALAAGIVIAIIWFLFSGSSESSDGFDSYDGFEHQGGFDKGPEDRWTLHPPPD
jgi:hypothetical protein